MEAVSLGETVAGSLAAPVAKIRAAPVAKIRAAPVAKTRAAPVARTRVNREKCRHRLVGLSQRTLQGSQGIRLELLCNPRSLLGCRCRLGCH